MTIFFSDLFGERELVNLGTLLDFIGFFELSLFLPYFQCHKFDTYILLICCNYKVLTNCDVL